MHTEIKEINSVMKELTVEVPWDDVKKDLDSTYRDLAKNVQVKGFRRGKAPTHIIRKLYGERVREEVRGNITERTIIEAIQKHELEIVAPPSVNPPEIVKGEPLRYTAQIEVRPTIESVVTEGLTVYQTSSTVADNAVDEELERIQRRQADVRPIEEPRPAAEGDMVTVDLKVEVEGEHLPNMDAADRRLELGKIEPSTIDAALRGVSPGDVVEVEDTIEEQHGDHTHEKAAKFIITLKEIHEIELPALDDEFAKDLEFESLDAMKTDIQTRLNDHASKRDELDLHEKLIDDLLRLNPLDIPPSMEREQYMTLLNEYLRFMQMTGQQPDYGPEVFEQTRSRAKRRVHASLILGALSKQLDIDVGEADIEAKLQERSEATGQHIAKLRAQLDEDARLRMESELLEAKLLAVLKEEATIHEGEDPRTPPEPEPHVHDENCDHDHDHGAAHGEEGHVHGEHCDHD